LVVSFRRSVIIPELWPPGVARVAKKVSIFGVFFSKNDPFRGNFRNSVPKRFIGNRSTCYVQILRNMVDRKSVKSCVAYLTKNFASLIRCRGCADRVHNLSGPAPDNVLRVFLILFKSVHFRWSYSRTREHR